MDDVDAYLMASYQAALQKTPPKATSREQHHKDCGGRLAVIVTRENRLTKVSIVCARCLSKWEPNGLVSIAAPADWEDHPDAQ